ncbi:MAG: MlaD family protein [Gammaproteobacteria bacterium]|nr:MlaD family protein [Gammaproteobacteria bacterium]
METKVNYALVGTFVIFLIASIVLSVIWLSAGFSSQNNTVYKVYMTESVSGLNLDAAVEFNGVGVGTVEKMEISPEDPHLVILLLKIKSDTPVTAGTRATLNIKGLTGNAYIALQDKGTDRAPLTISSDEDYPVIKTSPSLLFRLDNAVTQFISDMHRVSASVESLLNTDNQRSIRQSLINLQTITGTIADGKNQINAILKNTSTATQGLPMAIHSFENTTTNISSLSNEIKQNPSILLRGQAQENLGPGEQ